MHTSGEHCYHQLAIISLCLYFTGHWRNPWLPLMEPLGSAEPLLKTTHPKGHEQTATGWGSITPRQQDLGNR